MVAIYARQSVDREDSVSIESQMEACQYEVRGETCREYIDKGYSGKNTDRPRFQELLSDIRKGEISKVAVYRLDRISRSILDFANIMALLDQYQVEFVSSTEKFDTSTSMGRAMLSICMVFAQLERETIQQRVTDAYYSRSEKGFYMGGRIPYGFRLEEIVIRGKRTKGYAVCEEEAGHVRAMYQMYAEPGVSYGDIAAFFEQQGITYRGKPWPRARIADYLKNPIYVQADLDVYEFFREQGTAIESPAEDFIGANGCYYYKGKGAVQRKQAGFKDNRLVLAPHQGIIPSGLWLKCRKKCLHNKQIQPARKAVHTWLAGLVKCGVCHYALTYKTYNARNSCYFLCSHKMNSKACIGAGTIYADEFEAMIYDQITQKLREFSVLTQERESRESPEATGLRLQWNQTDQQIKALMDKVALANTDLVRLIDRRVSELCARREQLEQQLADCVTGGFESGGRKIENYLDHWERLTLNEKRKVAGSLIEVIYATSERVEIDWKI